SSPKNITFSVSPLIMVLLSYRGIAHEPLVDLCDCRIGRDVYAERKKTEANPTVYKTSYPLMKTLTSDIKQVDDGEYMLDRKYWEEGSPWKIQEDKTESKLGKEGYSAEIAKCRIEDTGGNDLTAQVLEAPRAILIFCYHPAHADPELIAKA